MIILDYKDRRPLYEQIVEKFSDLILKGAIKPDTQLPSVRSLAVDLSINPNTIQSAYAELERKGYIYVIKGRGNFVSKKEDFIDSHKEELLVEFDKVVDEAKDADISSNLLKDRIDVLYRREEKYDWSF